MERNNRKPQSRTTEKGRYLPWQTRFLCVLTKWPRNWAYRYPIIHWQNEIRELTDWHGKPLSKTYLKTVHNQLSAIFNHAARFYGLNINPARQAGNMGTEERKEMLFWTREEYTKFSEAMMDKPLSFYAFEMLYWCGLREGELLALTPADFNFEKRTVSINKSYQRLNKQDVITDPKTQKSNRVIQMPKFLCDEIQDYLKQLYGVQPDTATILKLTKKSSGRPPPATGPRTKRCCGCPARPGRTVSGSATFSCKIPGSTTHGVFMGSRPATVFWPTPWS